jgi:arginyl-tRNA synthetase
VIPADLDEQLAIGVRAIAPEVPASALPPPGSTWRPAADGDPAGYATSLPFALARRTGRAPAALASALAAGLAGVPWIAAAGPAGDGYLTITVTGPTLAAVAGRIAAAGPACGRSDVLAGMATAIPPWPELASARTWRQAWADQASAMTARLAATAGASAAPDSGRERAAPGGPEIDPAHSPVRAAAEYFGVDEIRYRLARTLPGQAGHLTAAAPGSPGHYPSVRLAHAEAASTLRWAGELGIPGQCPDPDLAGLLGTRPERELLGLLSWFGVRIAGAARRHRPGEVPQYLEQVAAAWTAGRLASPALPFGGAAAPRDPAVAAARLLLAGAVRAVLAAGLVLAGLPASARI